MPKIKEIIINQSKGAFSIFRIPRGKNSKEKEYDFSEISTLRQVLNNEKARILYTIKAEKPGSIYELSKKLGRGFKAVSDDVNLLKRFGFINIVEDKSKKRIRHRPELAVEGITIHLKI
jgi:predicted transcriptional regulator